MSKLQRLYAEQGQSPWLDNLTRGYLRDGTLAGMVGEGIRGVTANPTIFARAIEGSSDYDDQFAALTAAGYSVEDAYWELVVADITGALAVLRPVFDAAHGADGFVSVEVAPELARDTQATIVAARALHERIDEPNLFVKIPATAEGVPAVEAMINTLPEATIAAGPARPAGPCWSRLACSLSTTASRPLRSRSAPTSSTAAFSACSSRPADVSPCTRRRHV